MFFGEKGDDLDLALITVPGYHGDCTGKKKKYRPGVEHVISTANKKR
jgi:hypothetical protein